MNINRGSAATTLGGMAATPNPNPSAEMTFSTDGVQGDGVLDFSKLPPSPAQTPFTSPPIPVTSIPGLTATLEFPDPFPGGSLYSVINPQDLVVNSPTERVIVRFSQFVQGVSATYRVTDRFGHTFTMTANYRDAAPPQAQVLTSGFDWPGRITQVTPLQLLSRYRDISDVTLQTSSSFFENGSFELLNVRVQSGLGPDPASLVPRNGLRAWFPAIKSS